LLVDLLVESGGSISNMLGGDSKKHLVTEIVVFPLKAVKT